MDSPKVRVPSVRVPSASGESAPDISRETNRAYPLLTGPSCSARRALFTPTVENRVDTGDFPLSICLRSEQSRTAEQMLKNEIDDAKRTVSTDRVQITIGEIAAMYSAQELNILPDFQRLHRWSLEKKSNFVESILIGIPIPSVFVYETDAGTWELVDGLQRVSTILEFMGVLKDVDDPDKRKRSVLSSTKYLPSLEGVVWEEKNPGETELEKAMQLFFRRARLDFEILKHPSDPKTKYDLFQRLNRGGAYANEQEVRTCSMVLADVTFSQQLKEMTGRSDFRGVFGITDEQHQRQRDLEYLVRLIVHTFVEYSTKLDVEEYLSSGILEVIEGGRQEEAIRTISWVIETLYRIGGNDALLPAENRVEGVGGGKRFSLRALEVICVGISKNRAALAAKLDADQFIRDQIANFWTNPIAADLSSAGKRGTTRIQRGIPFGEKWFDPDAQDN